MNIIKFINFIWSRYRSWSRSRSGSGSWSFSREGKK
jgi:hypothetical protein